jgi:hypothetical protein
MMTSKEQWGVWMRPLYPNVAEAQWYPPHSPDKVVGSLLLATSEADRLTRDESVGGGTWPCWAFEAKPYDPRVGASF